MRVGQRVRVLDHNGLNKVIPVGNEAVIRAIENDRFALLVGDDLWVYRFDHLELVDDEGGPEGVVEWIEIITYVLYYASEECIARGLEADDIFTSSYSDKEEAEQEIEWYRDHNYKILASKKLTTRVPKP